MRHFQDNNLERAVDYIFSHAEEMDQSTTAEAEAPSQCRDGKERKLLPVPGTISDKRFFRTSILLSKLRWNSRENSLLCGSCVLDIGQVRSGQVWEHTPEQRVAASILRRYSFGLRLAIAQADARPAMPASFR